MIDRRLQVRVLIGADKLNPFNLTINFTNLPSSLIGAASIDNPL
jgi:hypothetical protein